MQIVSLLKKSKVDETRRIHVSQDMYTPFIRPFTFEDGGKRMNKTLIGCGLKADCLSKEYGPGSISGAVG